MTSVARRGGRSLIADIWVLAFCWIATSTATFSADRRVALVIGNSAYTNVPPLANPRNDADDVSNALKRIGFEVTTGIDLKKLEMDASFDRFAQSSVGASLAVLYFAGHGVQSAGENYLVPVDARLEDDSIVAAVTVSLHDIIKRIERISLSSVILLTPVAIIRCGIPRQAALVCGQMAWLLFERAAQTSLSVIRPSQTPSPSMATAEIPRTHLLCCAISQFRVRRLLH